jgi:RNA polymerase primary sigma factor
VEIVERPTWPRDRAPRHAQACLRPCRDEQEYESDRRCKLEAVQGMLGRLDDRERRILVNRYGLGGAGELTLEQLGRELGITKERVRQIESRAQDKLRKFARVRRPISPAF